MIPSCPTAPFTIQEWKHRATMGRDHEVKVVYAGFLFPFGHKASLVKVTERKFAPTPAGQSRVPVPALVHHRARADRGPTHRTRGTRRRTAGKRLDLVDAVLVGHVLTRVTPDLDDARQAQAARHDTAFGGGAVFFPDVDASPFLFKVARGRRRGQRRSSTAGR